MLDTIWKRIMQSDGWDWDNCLLCDVGTGHVVRMMGTRIGRHRRQGVAYDI